MSTIKTTNIQHPSAASPAIELTAAGGLWLGGGKVLQVVRATDSTNRSTTSTSYVDANISVTITPQKSDSAVLLLWIVSVISPTSNNNTAITITDNSNNAISGAENVTAAGSDAGFIIVPALATAYATPATTSATTYKGRFRVSGGTGSLRNGSDFTGQLYAIEVSE